jgi:hypothetical protein
MDECSDIAKDWGWIQDSVFDSLRDDFLAVVIVFHISHGFPAEQSCAKHASAGSGK